MVNYSTYPEWLNTPTDSASGGFLLPKHHNQKAVIGHIYLHHSSLAEFNCEQ
jgi:hypothetical protein